MLGKEIIDQDQGHLQCWPVLQRQAHHLVQNQTFPGGPGQINQACPSNLGQINQTCPPRPGRSGFENKVGQDDVLNVEEQHGIGGVAGLVLLVVMMLLIMSTPVLTQKP